MRVLISLFLVTLICSGCTIKKVKREPVSKSNVVIGIQSYSFRDYSLDELINAMVKLGINSCELWEGHVASVPIVRDAKALTAWRMDINSRHLKGIKEKFRSRGLRIQAYNANFKDDVTDDELEKAFQAARLLGTKCITSSATVSLMPRLDRLAKKYQIIVAMHNHDLVNKPNEFSNADSFNRGMAGLSDYIQINLDIGHFTAINQDPVAYIKEMHKKIPCVHIKDRKKNRGARTPFGEGDTPIGEVLRLIRDQNWPIVANIELEYPGDTMKEVEKSIAFCINELKKEVGSKDVVSQLVKTKDGLSVYTENGMELTMRRVQKDFIAGKPSYYDIWQLWESFAVEHGKRVQKIVRGGEWETAIRLKEDFVGGSMHGFERKTSIEFILDGEHLDETAEVPLRPFKKMIVKQHSDLYQLNSETEKIAVITKIWEINATHGLTIRQEIKWLSAQHIVAAYMTMVPVLRMENGVLVTSKASRDDIKGVVDVSQEGHVNELGARNKKNTSKKLRIWGDKYGLAIHVDRGKNLPNSSFWISNAKQYNKVYFDYCGNYVVKAGEIFNITSSISFY